MIRVHSEVKVYEVNDKEVSVGNHKSVAIESHLNSDKMVVLRFDDVHITVAASDIQQAISNATNSNRFG